MNLTKIATQTISNIDTTDTDKWKGSLFETIKKSSTCKKGLIGELIVKNYSLSLNYLVSQRSSVGNDLIVNGKKIEIKLSCYNKSGYFKWLQIRPDDDFDYLYLISVYPNNIKLYAFSKCQVLKLCDDNILKNQHGGVKNNNYNIKYLGIKECNIPEWFSNCELK